MKKKIYSNKAIWSLLALFINFQTYAHSHNHAHSKLLGKAQQASQGIFDNRNVKDRALSDWDGTWQSVYEYLENGDLDSVLQAKVIKNSSKTFDEHKAYYQTGYLTNILMIGIENNRIDFHKIDTYTSCEYKYDGYKILTYSSGKKGVRYLFTCKDTNTKAPKHIQFSDHIIEPKKTEHFHIFMSNESHQKLLEQMDNWPTYYPLSFSKDDIIHEMQYH